MITAVINTRDEEANIGRALGSLVGFADEVIVADMASTDRTREIAEAFGARVVPVPDLGLVEPAKKLAIAEARFSWIFVLDADEVIPAALASRLRDIARSDEHDAVEIHFDTFMFGHPTLHSGWSREREVHLRFFQRDAVTLPEETHTEVQVRQGARILRLPPEDGLAVVHYNYTDWSHFLAKLDRYTSLEAQHATDRGQSGPRTSYIAREFISRFVLDGGWRAGGEGLLLSLLMVCYRLLIRQKVALGRRLPDRAAIHNAYDEDAATR
ncbi:MAG: glycosyltransferase family 2 protein [Nocardioides sp.]|nr:glycosyltransferase family 2 protein [Nocardioides sp.]